MIRRCRNIRTKREATGQTVEEVSEVTRIPVAHLIAIEDERLQDLPAGPYASAYLRTLETHLGLPVGTPAPAVGRVHRAPQPKVAGPPLKTVRIAAGVGLTALVVMMIGQYVSQRPTEMAPVLNAGQALDQSVVISARRNTRLKVWVDGVSVADRNVTNGERFEFLAKDKVEVEIQAADAVRVEYNGNRIVPQGRQGEPRRLVFVDDVGGVR